MKRVRELAARYGGRGCAAGGAARRRSRRRRIPRRRSPTRSMSTSPIRFQRGSVPVSDPSGGHRVRCGLSRARPGGGVSGVARDPVRVAAAPRRRCRAPGAAAGLRNGHVVNDGSRSARREVLRRRHRPGGRVAGRARRVCGAAAGRRRPARRVEGGARRRRGAGWGGGGSDRGPFARSRRGGRRRSRARTPATCTSTSRPARRPTASPAGPAWPASALSPDGQVTVRSELLRHAAGFRPPRR